MAYRIYDNYVGADDNGLGDVIGPASKYGIDYMDVWITDSILNVEIKTYYDGGDHINYDMKRGALFISDNRWNPKGPAPYVGDNFDNPGEKWEYAYNLYNQTLYKIEDEDILLSDDEMPPSGYIYRNGQEVDVNRETADVVTVGTAVLPFTYEDYILKFAVDFGTLNWDIRDLGFHYASATCANDVIEGAVPEPATMMLLGVGLLGLGIVNRRKMKK